jgi:hypothetical protein
MDLSWLTASPWPIVIILSFLTGPALVILAFQLERGKQRAAERLLAEGELAEATVLSAKDSGWRTMGRTQIAVELEVRRPGRPPYKASTSYMIPRPWSPAPYTRGSLVQVRVDPERPERVVIATGQPVLGGVAAPTEPDLGAAAATILGSLGQTVSPALGGISTANVIVVDGKTYSSAADLPPDAREAYERAMSAFADRDGDGVPDIFGAAGSPAAASGATGIGSAERLRQLKAMRDEGLISAAEYEAKKAAILEQL